MSQEVGSIPAYTGTSILIVGFIIINYISAEFIFEERRLNEISENKFSSKITHYMVSHDPVDKWLQVNDQDLYNIKLFDSLNIFHKA